MFDSEYSTEIEPKDDILDALTAQILKYVVLKKHEARAVALWIVHTHGFDLFAISPRLKIQSPEPGCGKTTLLDVLRYTVRNPLLTAHTTAAAVFRAIADDAPTLLVDEADTSLTSSELVTILNAGHRRQRRRGPAGRRALLGVGACRVRDD